MPKSCFDGYLTDKCMNCPDWKKGDEYGYGVGCYTKLAIMLCPYFKKMYEKEEKKSIQKMTTAEREGGTRC